MGTDVFGMFWNAIKALIKPIVDFLVSFLPDGDPAIYSIIDGIGEVGGGSTFNVFYFCDWSAVLMCFGVLVSVVLIVQVIKLIFRSIDLGHKAIETIPVVE